MYLSFPYFCFIIIRRSWIYSCRTRRTRSFFRCSSLSYLMRWAVYISRFLSINYSYLLISRTSSPGKYYFSKVFSWTIPRKLLKSSISCYDWIIFFWILKFLVLISDYSFAFCFSVFRESFIGFEFILLEFISFN